MAQYTNQTTFQVKEKVGSQEVSKDIQVAFSYTSMELFQIRRPLIFPAYLTTR